MKNEIENIIDGVKMVDVNAIQFHCEACKQVLVKRIEEFVVDKLKKRTDDGFDDRTAPAPPDKRKITEGVKIHDLPPASSGTPMPEVKPPKAERVMICIGVHDGKDMMKLDHIYPHPENHACGLYGCVPCFDECRLCMSGFPMQKGETLCPKCRRSEEARFTFKFKWEDIDGYHKRMPIAGGWLVKAYEDVSRDTGDRGMQSGWDFRVTMTFVPDAKHEWIIIKE